MNRVLKAVLFATGAFAACYLCGAFAQASFNITEWKDGRELVAIAGFIFGAIIFGRMMEED